MRTSRIARTALEVARGLKRAIDPRVPSGKPPGWDSTKADQLLHVGIIGAGVAGLITARLLRDLGHEVTVFEAQNRVGGRIHTIRSGDHSTFSVDAGATRFSDSDDRMLYWLKRFDIPLTRMYPTSGRLVRLSHTGRQVGRDVANLSGHETHTLVSHPEYWESQYRPPRATALEFLGNSFLKPTWYRISDGASRLPEAIANTLEPDILLSSPASSIRQHDEGVDVHTNGRVFAFDKVVVTVPAAVYANVEFSPQLPPARLELIRNLSTQPSLRVFVAVQEGSWKSEGVCGWGCTEDGLQIWNFAGANVGSSTFVIYAQGGVAVPLLPLSRTEREGRLLDILETMFPGVRSTVTAVDSYCWNDDPWARGAQSINRGNTWKTAGEPLGRLHFAGEATASNGWVDGTILTAYRVVDEICGHGLSPEISRVQQASVRDDALSL